MNADDNQLEERIRQSLHAVSNSVDPTDDWDRINSQITRERRPPHRRNLFAAAAAIVLLFGAGAAGYQLRSNGERISATSSDDVSPTTPPASSTSVSDPIPAPASTLAPTTDGGFEACERAADEFREVIPESTSGDGLPEGPFTRREVVAIPSRPGIVVALLFSESGMLACEVSRVMPAGSKAPSLSASLTPFQNPPADGVVVVAATYSSSGDDPGVGPGRGYVIGYAGENVTRVDLTTNRGDVFSGDLREDGWFVAETETDAGVPMFGDVLTWEADGIEQRAGVADLANGSSLTGD